MPVCLIKDFKSYAIQFVSSEKMIRPYSLCAIFDDKFVEIGQKSLNLQIIL
jgi:hypothetical protein